MITAYTIQRNGEAKTINFVQSTISNDKLVVIKDEINEKLLLFIGASISDEVKRISSFAIAELNVDLNYEVVDIGSHEWESKKKVLLEMSKDPESKPVEPIKEELTEYPVTSSESNYEEPKPGYAPKPETRGQKGELLQTKLLQNEPVSPQEEKITIIDKETEIEVEQKIQEKPKSIAPVRKVEIKKQNEQIFVPIPDRNDLTVENVENISKRTSDVSKMIGQFKVAYDEVTGGEGFILVGELSKNIENLQGYQQIVEFFNSIKELSDNNSNHADAMKILHKQLDILGEIIFKE